MQNENRLRYQFCNHISLKIEKYSSLQWSWRPEFGGDNSPRRVSKRSAWESIAHCWSHNCFPNYSTTFNPFKKRIGLKWRKVVSAFKKAVPCIILFFREIGRRLIVGWARELPQMGANQNWGLKMSDNQPLKSTNRLHLQLLSFISNLIYCVAPLLAIHFKWLHNHGK